MPHDLLPVLVVYFGQDARFRRILSTWLDCFAKSGCRAPVSILTDPDTGMDLRFVESIGHDIPVLIADPDTAELASVQRPGNPYDRKSAIVCAYLLQAGRPRCVIVDVDAFFLADPSAALAPYRGPLFTLAPDAGNRPLPHLSGMPFGGREQSSSVMVFGGPDDVIVRDALRARLVDQYKTAWRDLVPDPIMPAIREQRAWSVVALRTGAQLLGRPLNWSRFWGAPGPDALILHAHGPEKFAWNGPPRDPAPVHEYRENLARPVRRSAM